MVTVWYNYLNRKDKDSLLSSSVVDEGSNKLYVCKESWDSYIKAPVRKFTSFETYLHFYEHMMLSNEQSKHYYEIIFSSMCVKPYFDIDLKYHDFDDKTIPLPYLEDQIKLCCKEFSECAAKCTEIPSASGLVFSSYSNVQESKALDKISFHIVVNNTKIPFTHSKQFCNYTMEQYSKFNSSVDSNIKEFFLKSIDISVYKNVQQFRMLGSRKLNSDESRIKLLNLDLSFNVTKDIHTNKLKQLSASLVTVGANCSFISNISNFYNYVDLKDREISSTRKTKFNIANDDIKIDLNDDEIDNLIKLIKLEFIKLGVNDFPFEIKGVNNNLVILKRYNESYCPICSRTHENDNPYIRIYPDKSARFYCRRDSMNRFIRVNTKSEEDNGSYSSNSSKTTIVSYASSVASSTKTKMSIASSVRSIKKLQPNTKSQMMLNI